ncbi:MAG: hypothetical protein RI556_11195 [Hydrogenovibrio sp.]|nr:hypothetical protein [Hydrogenovibrio sp.]
MGEKVLPAGVVYYGGVEARIFATYENFRKAFRFRFLQQAEKQKTFTFTVFFTVLAGGENKKPQ